MTYKFCILFILSCCYSFGSFATDKKKVATATYAVKKAKIIHQSPIQNQQISAGIVEIQAADANDYYSSLNGTEIIQLLNKNVNDAAIQRVVKSFKSDFELYNNAGLITYLWRNEGLAFKFNNKSNLHQISFYNSTEVFGAFCSAFQSELPYGLNFNKSRNKVENVIGFPIEISKPNGDQKFYASYNFDNNNLFATYNTNSSIEMNCTIAELMVMKAENKNIVITSISNNTPLIETSETIINQHQISNNQQPSIEKNPMSFIGKSRTDAILSKYIEELGTKEVEIIDYEQSSQYINKKEGIILNYDNSSTLASVIFINASQNADETYSTFQGKLPAGINFSLNMQEVNERMGSPMQVSNNMDTQYWEMYSINNGTDAMYISYTTKSSTIKSALISNIRVEKLK